MIDQILSIVKTHENWRQKQCLNLIPSENIMSPQARALLSSDLAHRYTSTDKFYMGTKYTDEIEQQGEKIAKSLFKAETADLRPLSGHIADLIVLANLTQPNDTLMCISPENGGYPGLWKDGLATLLKLKTKPLPFSMKDRNIKTKQTQHLIKKTKPRIIILGASLITFPHPVSALAETAQQTNTTITYDGSHVLGLIAGGQFQSPLREGAQILFGSTHKTFFGPQGGIILAKKQPGELIKQKIYPAYVDNAHWNRIAALTLALAEMQKYGKKYAAQVIRNAKELAKNLHDYRFPVTGSHLGYTQSHQIILDYRNSEKATDVAKKLQDVNIITDRVIRIGTCEITRIGMKETQMQRIAELINRTIRDKEKPQTVKKDVAKLVAEFQKTEYCFQS